MSQNTQWSFKLVLGNDMPHSHLHVLVHSKSYGLVVPEFHIVTKEGPFVQGDLDVE